MARSWYDLFVARWRKQQEWDAQKSARKLAAGPRAASGAAAEKQKTCQRCGQLVAPGDTCYFHTGRLAEVDEDGLIVRRSVRRDQRAAPLPF